MQRRSLSRQIVLSTGAVVLTVIGLFLVTAYVLYAFLFDDMVGPDPNPDDWLPSNTELVWMGSVTVIGLVLATLSAQKLARRILKPLNSVASGIRLAASGDLSARADAGDESLGETAELVRDFNALAERLERISYERTTWNAAIAHELRTPVSILRGRLQGLAEGVFDPDENLFRSLLTQVEGLSRLIDDLRIINLADSGHLGLELTNVHLAEEIRMLVALVQPSFEGRGLAFDLDLDEGLIHCDGIRVRQALLAVLDNTERYASPGTVYIRLRIHDDAVTICVEDEGPGMPDELRVHVFDIFRRGEGSRGRHSGGSGLGLAIVQAIFQAHGGYAICDAGRRNGSVFRLNLPRGEVSTAE
ncbi:MAG: Signal transduction histidine-protein kinase BaeS [Luteibacter sp.]|uniref:ATP-binding protein n=1 Tax=Luteibacter sp. TaxID=1886636 RepID=UPI00138583BA|nr:ATP-binding protein [Luteibacter sp.]KAF1005932.1 MAG: Signal transduction histidine-protein kinase BaeS [Luteibacter sp.]